MRARPAAPRSRRGTRQTFTSTHYQPDGVDGDTGKIALYGPFHADGFARLHVIS